MPSDFDAPSRDGVYVPISSGDSTYFSGLFSLGLDFIYPSPTIASAACDVDLMGQPIVRFRYICADGVGKDSYGWCENLYLRVNRLSEVLELVVDSEGDWSVEDTFPTTEIRDELIEAYIGSASPQDLLPPMLDAAASRLHVGPVTPDDISRIEGQCLIMDSSISDELQQRGRWSSQ